MRTTFRPAALVAVAAAVLSCAVSGVASSSVTIPRARVYLTAQLRARWEPDSITVKGCWRVSPSQVDCNMRINWSKSDAYCTTIVAAILPPSGRLQQRTLSFRCHTPPLVVPPVKGPPTPIPPHSPGGLGAGHSIERISYGEPIFITLEDQSVWKIKPSDESAVRLWSVGDSILISTNTRSAYYTYVLDDRTAGTWADARYVPRF